MSDFPPPAQEAVRLACPADAINVEPLRLWSAAGLIDLAYERAFMAESLATPLRPISYFYPEMAGFRADPRFMTLAERHGLASFWLESGAWPDFCAEPDLPYDCVTEARKAVATSAAAAAQAFSL
jgi:hypothetical protein